MHLVKAGSEEARHRNLIRWPSRRVGTQTGNLAPKAASGFVVAFGLVLVD
jgi:hypothetical protein